MADGFDFVPYKKGIPLVLTWSYKISEGYVWVNCFLGGIDLREEIPDFIRRWCRKASSIILISFNTENMRKIGQIRLTTFDCFICVVWNYAIKGKFFIPDKMETWYDIFFLNFLHQGSDDAQQVKM